MRSSREASDSSDVVKSLKETFLAIDVRWNAAGISYFFHPSIRYLTIDVGVYLQLLEAQEVTNRA